MKKKNLDIGISLPYIFSMLLVFSLLFIFLPHFNITGVVRNEVVADVTLSDCENLSLDKFVSCMVNYVTPFYNYKIIHQSPDKYNFSDILLNGGGCSEYTYIYETISLSHGFNHTKVYIPEHVFSVITDINHSGYCIVDGLDYNCWRFKE